MAKRVTIQFPSGRELLGSYWGFLKDGGLVLSEPVIPPDLDACEGENLSLEVHIRTLKQAFRLGARTVKRSTDGSRLFVAFDAGQDNKDHMLNAAWADTHDVPQRKHRRFDGVGAVSFAVDGSGSASGEVLDVSPGGLRLRGPAQLPIGAVVQVQLDEDEIVEGRVRWSTRANEMGIEFTRPFEMHRVLNNKTG